MTEGMMKAYIASLAALSLALPAPALHAQTPGADVQPLLDQVAAAYHDLTAFSATVETTQSGGPTERKITTKLTLQKPAKLAAEIHMGTDVGHVVADGTTLYIDSSRDKTHYMKQPATTIIEVVNALARSGGAGVGLLPILLTDPNAAKRIIPGPPTSVK